MGAQATESKKKFDIEGGETRTTSIRINDGLKEAVEHLAAQDNRTFNNYLENLLKQHCKEAGIVK